MTLSPTKKKQTDFFEALRQAFIGKKIRRISWPEGEHGEMQEDMLMIIRNGTHRWILSKGDMEGDDWIAI